MTDTRRRDRVAAPAPAGGVAARAALLILAGTVAYGSILTAPFLFDDQNAIVNNPQIRQMWPLSVPLTPPRDTPVAGRPLVNLTFAINYALGGLDGRGYHVANIAVHLLAGLVLFGWLRRALLLPKLADRFASSATNLAWACALLWTLHPLQTEAVNYLSERTESMMGMFYFLTLYCSVRALGRHSGRWSAGAVIVCAAGMACKESMVTAPVIAVLFDRIFVFGSWRDMWTARWKLHAGLAATWLVLAALMWGTPRTSAGFSSGADPWVYLLNQLPMIVQYLRLTVWPRALVLDYGLPQPLAPGDVLVPGAVVLMLALATVVALVRRPDVGFLGAWFFIALAPTTSIVPIATEVGAERRMYVPLAAIVILAVLAVHRLAAWARGPDPVHVPAPRRTARSKEAGRPDVAPASRAGKDALYGWMGWAAVGIVSALMIAGIILRTREYRSALEMARTVVDRWPNGRGHYLLGTALIDAGQQDEAMRELRLSARDYPGALFAIGTELLGAGSLDQGIETLQQFIRAMPVHPNVIPAREMLGRGYAAQGKLDAAAEQFDLLLRVVPGHARAHRYLGDIRVQQARVTEAANHYEAALKAEPGNPEVLASLGIALASAGRLDDAVGAFQRAVTISPNDAAAHNLLGRALAARGQLAAAQSQFEQALRINPADADARRNLNAVQQTASGSPR